MSTDHLPSDWRIRKLGDLCEKPQYGFTASAIEDDKRPRFLRITDQGESGIDWASVPGCECSDEDIEKYRLEEGDLVVARIGATTGKVSLVQNPPKAVFASYLIRLRAKPGVSPEYLSHFSRTDFYRAQIAANNDSNLKGGINGSRLVELDVIEPPVPEQHRIAAVLTKLQRAVELEAAQERAARELMQAGMRQLFTRGLRYEPLRDTPLGPLPESWTVETVGTCLTKFGIDRSLQIPASAYRPKGRFPVIDQGQDYIAGYTDDEARVISDDLPIVVFGDHTRVVKFVDFPFAVGADGTKLLKPRSDIDRGYFHRALEQLSIESRGYNRHFKYLAESLIPLPPPADQSEIAAILGALDRKIELHAARRRARRDLFRSTLHALMTARLRVPVDLPL
jgi:type I restriction enzyme S subunit